MPQGDKSSYTDKQKRQAAHIEAGYEQAGLSPQTAAGRAWATVNKLTGGEKAVLADAMRARHAAGGLTVKDYSRPAEARTLSPRVPARIQTHPLPRSM